MTDNPASAEDAVSRLSVRRPASCAPGTAAALAAMLGLLGAAFRMAYVDPYNGHRRRPTTAPDDDLNGRDPDW